MKRQREIRTRRSEALNLVHKRTPPTASVAKHGGKVNEEPAGAHFTLDRQGRVSAVNEVGALLLGFPVSWLLGKVFVVFVARQHVQLFLETLRYSLRAAGPHSITVDLFAGAKTLPVRICVSTSSTSEITHQLTITEVLDNDGTARSLQEMLSNWYSVLHNAPDTILTVNFRGRIDFINKPLWGYSAGALLGTNILDYVPDTEHQKLLHCLTESFRFNRRSMCDLTGLNQDFTRWFNFSFGKPQSYRPTTKMAEVTTTVVIREISEDKRKEENLRASGEQLRDFAAHVEAVREEERARVAREIHDELGQALTALKLDLSWVEGKTRRNSVLKKKMQVMITDIDSTIERVRRISSELRPAILDDLGLIPALEWQLLQFRKRTRVRTRFMCPEDRIDLTSEAAAAVFRVVQEALTNVMRHAKATKLHVSIHRVPQGLRFTIADNGRGMVSIEESGIKSLGIVGMKERITRLGGDFKLFSEPGKGTRLDFTIPQES